MFRRSSLYPKLLICALVALPACAFAGPALSISSPAADGVFVLRGTGLEGGAGLDLFISYDSATLSDPRVSLGSVVEGMVNVVNPGNPVRLAIIPYPPRTITTSGTIATISFNRTGASPGKITDVSGTALLKERMVALPPAEILNPSTGSQSGSSAGASGGSASDGSGAGGSTPSPLSVGGTVTVAAVDFPGAGTEEAPVLPIEPPGQAEPQDQPEQPAQTEPQTEQQTEPAPQESPVEQGGGGEVPAEVPAEVPGEMPADLPGELPVEIPADLPAEEMTAPGAARPPQSAAPKKGTPVPPLKPGQSVLDSFRLFEGERTVESLTALFQSSGGASARQSPAIAIADGTRTVTVTISKLVGDSAPKFSFDAARFVALARAGEGELALEVRPDQGVSQASVIILNNGGRQELPLTVAPPADIDLDRSGGITEADFQLFLSERGTPAEPRFDLNGDGRRDYLDDYIFTANYLVQSQGASRKETGNTHMP